MGYAPIDWYSIPFAVCGSLACAAQAVEPLRDAAQATPTSSIHGSSAAASIGRCSVRRSGSPATIGSRVEIARELDDFVEANPTGLGINWTCTMDVGLRAVSWAIGLELIRQSGALDDAFWERAYTALFDHGVFIRNNLENTYEVTSNHFLSNMLGLQFVGAVFADLPQGDEWTSFARDRQSSTR